MYQHTFKYKVKHRGAIPKIQTKYIPEYDKDNIYGIETEFPLNISADRIKNISPVPHIYSYQKYYYPPKSLQNFSYNFPKPNDSRKIYYLPSSNEREVITVIDQEEYDDNLNKSQINNYPRKLLKRFKNCGVKTDFSKKNNKKDDYIDLVTYNDLQIPENNFSNNYENNYENNDDYYNDDNYFEAETKYNSKGDFLNKSYDCITFKQKIGMIKKKKNKNKNKYVKKNKTPDLTWRRMPKNNRNSFKRYFLGEYIDIDRMKKIVDSVKTIQKWWRSKNENRNNKRKYKIRNNQKNDKNKYFTFKKNNKYIKKNDVKNNMKDSRYNYSIIKNDNYSNYNSNDSATNKDINKGNKYNNISERNIKNDKNEIRNVKNCYSNIRKDTNKNDNTNVKNKDNKNELKRSIRNNTPDNSSIRSSKKNKNSNNNISQINKNKNVYISKGPFEKTTVKKNNPIIKKRNKNNDNVSSTKIDDTNNNCKPNTKNYNNTKSTTIVDKNNKDNTTLVENKTIHDSLRDINTDSDTITKNKVNNIYIKNKNSNNNKIIKNNKNNTSFRNINNNNNKNNNNLDKNRAVSYDSANCRIKNRNSKIDNDAIKNVVVTNKLSVKKIVHDINESIRKMNEKNNSLNKYRYNKNNKPIKNPNVTNSDSVKKISTDINESIKKMNENEDPNKKKNDNNNIYIRNPKNNNNHLVRSIKNLTPSKNNNIHQVKREHRKSKHINNNEEGEDLPIFSAALYSYKSENEDKDSNEEIIHLEKINNCYISKNYIKTPLEILKKPKNIPCLYISKILKKNDLKKYNLKNKKEENKKIENKYTENYDNNYTINIKELRSSLSYNKFKKGDPNNLQIAKNVRNQIIGGRHKKTLTPDKNINFITSAFRDNKNNTSILIRNECKKKRPVTPDVRHNNNNLKYKNDIKIVGKQNKKSINKDISNNIKKVNDNNGKNRNNYLLSKVKVINNNDESLKNNTFSRSELKSFCTSSLQSVRFKYNSLYYINYLKYLFLDNKVFYLTNQLKKIYHLYQLMQLLKMIIQKIQKNINQYVFYEIKQEPDNIKNNIFFSIIKNHLNDIISSNVINDYEFEKFLNDNLKNYVNNYQNNNFIPYIIYKDEDNLINSQLFINTSNSDNKIISFIINYLKNRKNSVSNEQIINYLQENPIKDYNLFTLSRYADNFYNFLYNDDNNSCNIEESIEENDVQDHGNDYVNNNVVYENVKNIPINKNSIKVEEIHENQLSSSNVISVQVDSINIPNKTIIKKPLTEFKSA